MPAELICFEERCRTRFSIDEVIYNCPRCGGLLETTYPDLRVDPEGVDRLLAGDRIPEVHGGRDRTREHLRGDHRLPVAVGAERHLVLEDDPEARGEDQDGNDEDRRRGGPPSAAPEAECHHPWFTLMASASRRELIVRPRACAWALSM